MISLDSVLKFATEKAITRLSDQSILLSRLLLSLDKIINSLQKHGTRTVAPQAVHIQAIENILYQAPQHFDASTLNLFFSLKNDLDCGHIDLPLPQDCCAQFVALRQKVQQAHDSVRSCQRRIHWFTGTLYVVLAIAFAVLLMGPVSDALRKVSLSIG